MGPTWQKKKGYKVLDFPPDLEPFLGKTELCFPWAREEALSSMVPDGLWVAGSRCHFHSERGLAVLGLLG